MRKMGGLLGAAVAAFIAMGLVGLLIATTGARASAQGTCNEDFGQFEVSTAEELNFAISCFNSATFDDEFSNVNVFLLNNIEVDTLADGSVFLAFTQQDQSDFWIEGNGYTIRRSAAAPSTPAPLFSIAPGSGTAFTVLDTNLEVGQFDTFGVHDDGDQSSIRMWTSSIVAGPNGTNATAIFAGVTTGEHSVQHSWFNGVAIGVDTASPAFGVASSTITSTNVDFVTGPDGGFGFIDDSTLAGPIGIQGSNSRIDVNYSTILGDGASFPTGNDGGILIRSSIVAFCSSPELDIDGNAGGGYVDLGNNVGGCFDAGDMIDTLLADNGCTYATPRGCAPTVALSPNSPAVAAGDCTDGSGGDQRGTDRTPVGPGCDAGAFEIGPPPPFCSPDDRLYTASTAAQLNAAIECYNIVASFASSFKITLLNDIDVDTLAGPSVIAEITKPNDTGLTIEGNGHIIRRGPDAPQTSAALLRMAPDSGARLTLRNVGFELGEFDTVAIRNDGFGVVMLLAGSITAGPDANNGIGIFSGPNATEPIVGGSYITGVDVGIQILSSTWLIDGTTIASTGIDVLLEGDGRGRIENSTLAGPIGIQLPADGGSNVDYTTVLGDAAFVVGDAQGGVSFVSSVVASCSAPVVEPFNDGPGPQAVDLGSNVGGCFDPTHVIDTELADNGCLTATPAGCPPTVQLTAGSIARNAGNCTAQVLDQTGQPHTPQGPGCDAGAVEFDPCSNQSNTAAFRTTFEVSTAEEFNAAIECYNADGPDAPDYEVTLLNDIEATSLNTASVFAPIAGPGDVEFVIRGEGFTLRRGPDADTFEMPLLSVQSLEPASFAFSNLSIEVGPYDSVGIVGEDASRVTLISSSIFPAEDGSSAVGVQVNAADAELTVWESSIEGLRLGVEFRGTQLEVIKSTIVSTQLDLYLEFPDAFSPGGYIDNSTLGGPDSIRLLGGWLDVSHTTVLGDGALSQPGPYASIRYKSSIVHSCSLPVFSSDNPPLDGQFVLAFDGNIGGCFNPGQVLESELADNGCERATPTGCPRTVALDVDSLARGVGSCFGLATDQRGFPRGLPCDAGSYEWQAPPICYQDDALNPVRSRFDVATAEELNLAILCIDRIVPDSGPRSATITLLDDITATASGELSVFDPISTDVRGQVTLDGNGFSIRRGPEAGDDLLPLLLFTSTLSDRVEVADLAVEVGPFDTAAIQSTGQGDFDASYLAIAPGPQGSQATGVIADHTNGDVFIRTSFIDGLPVGARLDGVFAGVATSTLASTQTDIEFGGSGFSSVGLSTLAGPIAIDQPSGSVFVGLSTILGDLLPAGSLTRMTVTSSAVNSCSTFVSTDPDAFSPVIIDDGGNVGGCFVSSHVIDTQLADNGCVIPTPAGCAPTVAVSDQSPARGAGDCGGPGVGPRVTDQRGFPRSPAGPGCDAGSFERLGCDGNDFVVADEGSLNGAITCFNLANAATPTRFTITLDADITLSPGEGIGVYTTIIQRDPDLTLVIDGAGFTLDSSNSIDTLLLIAGTNRAAVELTDIVIDQSRIRFETVDNQGTGPLTVINTAMVGAESLLPNTALRSASAPVTVVNSYLTAGFLVVRASSGSSTVISSTLDGGVGLAVGRDDTVLVENSTIAGRFGGVSLGPGKTGTIRNTTFLGPSTSGLGGSSAVELISNYFAGECPQDAIVAEGNYGACFFGPQRPVLTLADNGCLDPTPLGCVPTAAIDVASGGIGVGVCDGVARDQRGEPRTPLGAGCDAGAYEVPGFDGEPESGDVDADGTVDTADVQALLTYLSGGDEPAGLAVADVNDDGQVNLADALLLAQNIAGG